MQNKDDGFYIEKVLNGEAAAYAILVEKHKTLVYNIALKIVKKPEDAEEITQDAFVKAYRSLRSFKGDSRFSTWLYRIVYNTSITFIRKKQREVPVDNESSEIMLKNPDLIDDDGSTNSEFLTTALKMAVDALPPSEQTIITLYYYDNSSVEDIAKIMSLSVSNVKVKLFRTRKKLYDQIRLIMNKEISV